MSDNPTAWDVAGVVGVAEVELVHWHCCLDVAVVHVRSPRSFCGEDTEGRVADEDSEAGRCFMCVAAQAHLEATGRCPVRGHCCPQFDDICQGGADA